MILNPMQTTSERWLFTGPSPTVRPADPQCCSGGVRILATGLFVVAGPEATRIDAFYVVYGVARSLLPTPEASLKAARARVVGTLFGGLVMMMLIQAVSNSRGHRHVLVKLLGSG